MNENDIVKIVVNQRHIPTGQPIINVYHFLCTDVVGDWTSPLDFNQVAAEVFLGMHSYAGVFQTTEIAYDNATYQNLTNGLDLGIYIPPLDTFGVVESATMPLQVAASFKLVRTTAATRNGSKRFGGIADSLVNDATGQGLAGLAQTSSLEDWLASPIQVVVGGGNECTLVPIIVRKPSTNIPPTVYNRVLAGQFRGTGSQNSRKKLL